MSSLDHYIAHLETLSPANLGQLRDLVCDDVHFSDPFNDITGADHYLALLNEMFDRLDDIHFTVHEVSREGMVAHLYWTYSASSKLTGQLAFQGTSRIVLAENGLVACHQDFWDSAAVYGRLPLIGRLMGWLKKRTAYRG